MAKQKKFTEQILIFTSPEQKTTIDEWRGKQPGVPNRSEAIRRLIDRALSMEKKTRKRKTD